LSEAFKVCPICETRNQRHAAICATCGTTIAEIAPQEAPRERDPVAPRYEFRLGETDLAEESLRRPGRILSVVLVLFFAIGLAGIAFALYSMRIGDPAGASVEGIPTMKPTRIAGPTVTSGPPTASYTPSPRPTMPPTDTLTPSPCVRKVAAGDSLIGIILRCGHQNLELLPTVMQLNAIADEALIHIGQEIVVPLPSPTLDPAATATPADDEVNSASASSLSEGLALLAFDPLSPTLTPTLLPGLMWHIVQPDENMILIALLYETTAKALSDLNPEIDFSLCDFSSAYGGPECTVQLWQNQRIRVPAPTPTITPIPTASGSETPTPLPTATFNAPIAQSPASEAFFSPLEQVTLRWVATGRLSPSDVYQVTLTDTDTGASYTAETRELFFIVPDILQPRDSISHHYSWRVSVLDTNSGRVSHASPERSFVWQGAGQTSS